MSKKNNLSLCACTHIKDTVCLQNEQKALSLFYKLISDFNSKWYVIDITKKGCIVKIRSKKLFFLGKGKTLHEAVHSLLQKLIDCSS